MSNFFLCNFLSIDVGRMLSIAPLSAKSSDTSYPLNLDMTYNGRKWLQALSVGIVKVTHSLLSFTISDIMGSSNNSEAMTFTSSSPMKSPSNIYGWLFLAWYDDGKVKAIFIKACIGKVPN